MQIDERIYAVGSGWAGCNLTNHYDCDIYLVDCGEKLVMIDAGAGIAVEQVEKLIHFHGFSMRDIEFILLTHTHGDHAGGAKKLQSLTGAELLAHPDSAGYLKSGDQKKMSVDIAVERGCIRRDLRWNPARPGHLKTGRRYRWDRCPLRRSTRRGIAAGTIRIWLQRQKSDICFPEIPSFWEGKYLCRIFGTAAWRRMPGLPAG